MLSRRIVLGLLFAAALGFLAGPRLSRAAGFGESAADSVYVDSLRAVILDSLHFAAADTARLDSLLVTRVHDVLLDSLVTAGGDTVRASVLAARRVITYTGKTGADSAAVMTAAGVVPEGPGFHPSYRIGFRNDRDSQSLNQSLQEVAFNVGSRLRVSTGGVANQKKSKNFAQENRARSSKTELNYRITRDVSIVSTFQVNSNQNETATGKRTVSSNNFQAGTAFTKVLAESLLASVDITGGTAGNKNQFYDSRGSSGQVHGTLDFRPDNWVKTTGEYTGSRASQRSENRDRGGVTQDKDREDKLHGTTTFTLPGTNNVALDYSLEMGTFQRPDTVASGTGATLQETKTVKNTGLGINSDLKVIRGLQLRLEGTTTSRLNDFELQRDAYTRVKDKSARVSTGYTLPMKTALSASYSDQLTRSEYRPDPGDFNRTGDTRFRTLNGSLRQPVGSKFSLDASGSLSLQVYNYDDKVSYDQDHDALDSRVTVKGDYRPSPLMGLLCEFSVRNSEIIYILPARSSQNSTAQTFSLRPALTFRLSKRVVVTQTYGLDATYTEYVYNVDNNTVSRSASLTTALSYDLTSRVGIGFAHEYRDQDSGKLLKSSGGDRAYTPRSETERQEVRVNMEYRAAKLMTLTFLQRVQLDRSWEFASGRKGPVKEEVNEYLSAEMKGRANLQDHLAMSYQAALNLGEGIRVPETQKRYWTSSVDLTYTF